jgi:hypothetical protein
MGDGLGDEVVRGRRRTASGATDVCLGGLGGG